MLKAIDLNDQIKYISPSDIEEPKTVWLLGTLDMRIRKQLEDIAIEYETTPGRPESAKAKASFNIGKSELEFVAFGLKGFENFNKPDGKPMYFKTEPRVVGGRTYQVVAEDVIKVIPIISELAMKIKEINTLGEVETKNS